MQPPKRSLLCLDLTDAEIDEVEGKPITYNSVHTLRNLFNFTVMFTIKDQSVKVIHSRSKGLRLSPVMARLYR
jgi:hypothetical protein